MLNVASLVKGDVRRALLQLQWWCQSGGGRSQMILDLTATPHRPTHVDKHLVPSSKHAELKHDVFGTPLSVAPKTLSKDTKDDNSDDDFTSIKPRFRNKRSLVRKDDISSCSSVSNVSSPVGSKSKLRQRQKKSKSEKHAKSRKGKDGGKSGGGSGTATEDVEGE